MVYLTFLTVVALIPKAKESTWGMSQISSLSIPITQSETRALITEWICETRLEPTAFYCLDSLCPHSNRLS